MQKNYDIEALRGYAVAITFVAHLDGLFASWGPYLAIFWLGGGVDLFFAISGFLITTSLLQSVSENPDISSYATRFWIRRIFRLWPAALLWSTLYAIISILIIWKNDDDMQKFIAINWIFSSINLQNFYIYYCAKFDSLCKATALWHYWSLSLEEQFYIITPIVIFFTPNRKMLILPVLVLAIWQSATIRPWGELLWFIRTDALFYGVATALVCYYYPERVNRLRRALPRWFWQVALWGALVSLIALSRPTASQYFMGYVAASAGAIVFIISGNQNLLTAQTFGMKIARYAGSRSYSLYLVHMPVISIVHQTLIGEGRFIDAASSAGKFCGVLVALLISLVLAEISYRFVENPLRRYGRAISSKRLSRLSDAMQDKASRANSST